MIKKSVIARKYLFKMATKQWGGVYRDDKILKKKI